MKKNHTPPKHTEPMLYIGSKPESIEAARKAINDILASPAADVAKQAALGALRDLCAVSNVTVSNNHFEG